MFVADFQIENPKNIVTEKKQTNNIEKLNLTSMTEIKKYSLYFTTCIF